MICSNHGRCDCGKCTCFDGWKGKECECSTSLTNCTSPNGLLCSNHGDCECGQCTCNVGYLGTFCENQPGQNNSLCVYYEGCVQAKIRQRLGEKVPTYMEECAKEGIENTHEFVSTLEGKRIKFLFLRISLKRIFIYRV